VIGQSRRQVLQGSLALVGISLLAGCNVLPRQGSPTSKITRIGYLSLGSASDPALDAFRQGLVDLGYIEGQNLVVEYRIVEAGSDQLAAFAAELVQLPVDIIVARGTPPILAAKNATSTIPVVFGAANDPVGAGFVTSLASPGANVTGSSALTYTLGGKRLELLKQAAPSSSRVALLAHHDDHSLEPSQGILQDAAQRLALELHTLVVRGPEDVGPAFQAAAAQHADALLVVPGPIILTYHPGIVAQAAAQRLPAIYYSRDFVTAGGLMAYGANTLVLWRRLATTVDKILKGTKPSDVPVEQATMFDFFINLKTAQALRLTIPPSVLQQATEVIQ